MRNSKPRRTVNHSGVQPRTLFPPPCYAASVNSEPEMPGADHQGLPVKSNYRLQFWAYERTCARRVANGSETHPGILGPDCGKWNLWRCAGWQFDIATGLTTASRFAHYLDLQFHPNRRGHGPDHDPYQLVLLDRSAPRNKPAAGQQKAQRMSSRGGDADTRRRHY